MPEDGSARDRLFQSARKEDDDPDRYNPYRLRAEALERTLAPHELGRALQHLGLRRGYKSNRKEASDEDGGKLKERMDALRGTVAGGTLGQYLWRHYREEAAREDAGGRRRGIRFRADTDLYPDRAMFENEFAAIRECQAPHHRLITADWDRLRDESILFQWPLKLVERGACEFFADEPRHWKDTPIGHDFRIHQEFNALRWIDRDNLAHDLDAEQRGAILELLHARKSEVKFTALRKLKRSDGDALFPCQSQFNLEDEKRKGIDPHRIAAQMRDDPLLAPLWQARAEVGDGGRLDDAFDVLHGASDDREAKDQLTSALGLDDDIADALVGLRLTAGTGSVSRKFMERVVPVMRDQGLIYAEAVAEITDDDGNPLHHLRDDGRRWPRLPYYGEVLAQSMLGADPAVDPGLAPERHFGRINNPTVHVALNQLRRLVNTLTDRFGTPPVEIHVELIRDLKLSRKQRDEIAKEQAANDRENKRLRTICTDHGLTDPTIRDLKKVKLWEELGKNQLARSCVFSGQPISGAQLFNGEAEIEHLLPFARTLDDSMANLTVAMRWANRLKGNGTPHESFHGDRHADRGIYWTNVLARAETLPKRKRWRFGPEAMARFERDGGFVARQLTDTAYMARVAQRYLSALDGVAHVVPNRGRLTAMVRGKWGLNGLLSDDNRKTRDDHRHHAVDAAVIALTDRSVLNAVSRLTARGADDIVRLAVPELDEELSAAIRARVADIVVAYKPEHGLQGRMYNETAYGFVKPERRDPDLPEHGLVTRKPLASLTLRECEAIRDRDLRAAIRDHLEAAEARGHKHDQALIEFSKDHGLDRVRILVTNQTVRQVGSAPYKAYAPDSYVCCDIWRVPKGRPGKWRRGKFEWVGAYWSYAETIGGVPDKTAKKPQPAARFITRLFKDDMIAYEEGGETRIMRVAGFSTTNNKLNVKPHHLADAPKTYKSINVLCGMGLKKLHVTPDGRVLETRQVGGAES